MVDLAAVGRHFVLRGIAMNWCFVGRLRRFASRIALGASLLVSSLASSSWAQWPGSWLGLPTPPVMMPNPQLRIARPPVMVPNPHAILHANRFQNHLPLPSLTSRLRPVVPNAALGVPNLGAQGYGSAQGVVVTGVSYGSAAWRLGLEPGDRIVQINDQCVRTNQDVQAVLLQALAYQNGQITVLIDDVRSRQVFGVPQKVMRTTFLDRHSGGHWSGYPNYPDHCALW